MKTKKQFKEPNNLGTNFFIQCVKNQFFILMITLLLPLGMTAQSETVYQNWTMIEENEDIMIEVSGKVLKCDFMNPTQLYIEIFNESSIDQVAHFNLILTNPQTNAEEVHEISLSVLQGAIKKPSCENDDYPSLRLNIPDGWDPATVQLSLTFIL